MSKQRIFNNPTLDDVYFVHPGDIQISSGTDAYGNNSFQKLPPPIGPAPYHLKLEDVLSSDDMQKITKSGKIMFHAVGDTGGVKNPQHQIDVANQMAADFYTDNKPSFFYHLGDVVYFFGEGKEYYSQFYEPYIHYKAPIFAIPGNHDADVYPSDKTDSLAAFMKNFCSKTVAPTDEAGDACRDAMTQPNVYWTLEAPYVTIIGLYTNVPEHGVVDSTQKEWLLNELKTAPEDKP